MKCLLSDLEHCTFCSVLDNRILALGFRGDHPQMSLQTCHKCHFRRPTLTPHRSIHSVFIRSWIHLSISQLAQQARHEISHQSSLCLSVSVCASALTRKLLRACFTCLKVLKKRSWNWITKEVRLLVEEKKQISESCVFKIRPRLPQAHQLQHTGGAQMHKTQFLKLMILHSELWPLSLSESSGPSVSVCVCLCA